MNITTSGSFPAVSNDTVSADNQPIERTYRVVAYNSTTWFNEIQMHSHVFIRPTSKAGLMDPAAHVQGPQRDSYFALTPAQLNYELHRVCLEKKEKGETYNPYEAARDWTYVGICMSPPTETKFQSSYPSSRFIVCHMRSARPMDNYWYDAKGTEWLSFVFKNVSTTLVKNFVIGPYEVKMANSSTKSGETMETCVQLVAVRSLNRFLSAEALMRKPGVVDPDDKWSGMGVQVPVGLMTYNPYAPTSEREEDKYAKVGDLCHDAVKASSQHVQAMTLAV